MYNSQTESSPDGRLALPLVVPPGMIQAAVSHATQLVEQSRSDSAVAPAYYGRPRITSVGIIGAGVMGRSIAAAMAGHGISVVIHDLRPDILEAATRSIAADLHQRRGIEGLQAAERLVRAASELAEVGCCDLVLESIVESLWAKRQLFVQLEKILPPQALLVSNTSTIPIARLSDGMAASSRFCAMHFCHPVDKRPLVEIVPSRQTAAATIAAVFALVRKIGKTPLVVADSPGFVVNRLLFPYLDAGLRLLAEGFPVETIDRAAVEFGMEFGPLALMDQIGLDTVLQAGSNLAAAFPDRIESSPLLVSMVKAGKLGCKSGIGFYAYQETTKNASDSDILRTVDNERLKDDLAIVVYRLVLPMLWEAIRLLKEGVVSEPRDIDLAALYGLGFPAERGGLLWWADCIGPAGILTVMDLPGCAGLGAELRPTIESMAQTDGRFYAYNRLSNSNRILRISVS